MTPNRMRRKWLLYWLLYWLLFEMLAALAAAQSSRKPELIRDTDVAEGKDTAEAAPAKEPSPEVAKHHIGIGNYYFNQKNYIAAIQRYLEALEYEPHSLPAYEALSRAYEKNGELSKAIQALKSLMEHHPDYPKLAECNRRLAQLEKKLGR